MKPTVYIETTIVSYLTAWPSRDILRLSHEMITREWWEKRRPDFELYTSEFVVQEASRGDASAAAERLKALAGLARLPVTPEVPALAGRLAVALQLPQRALTDAAHVAVAAINNVSFVLTWNCAHLANGILAAKIEQTCLDAGYRAPRILTPDLLMERP